MIRFLLIAFSLLLIASPAEAKRHHYRHHFHRTIDRLPVHAMLQCDNSGRPCVEDQRTSLVSQARFGGVGVAGGSEGVIGGRPSGCPHAYCGCGARLYLGLSDVRLNLAWNWTRYYSGSTPVAVWHHHVAIIERMTGPHTAILRDYNSGRGLSRIHERSLAGARIIGARYASR